VRPWDACRCAFIRRVRYTKRDWPRDHELLLPLVGERPVNLCGYDSGANTAYAYAAAQWPGEVERVAFPGDGVPRLRLRGGHAPEAWLGRGCGSSPRSPFSTCASASSLVGSVALLAWYFWRSSDNPNAVSMEDFEVYGPHASAAEHAAGRNGVLRGGVGGRRSQPRIRAHQADHAGARGRRRKAIADGVAQGASHLAEDVQGVVLEGAGHWLTDERPGELADLLLRFFSSTG
jgi:pimeloyl-ACP methyl ester carboxylesterase